MKPPGLVPPELVHSMFIGGGPAGLAPLVWAARQGTLPRLAAAGLVLVERGATIGAGSIGDYAIGSDTLAETFLECLQDGAEPRLGALRDHPAALAVAAHRGGSVPLPVAAGFLSALGAALAEAIRAAGGRVLTGWEAAWSRRRADGGWLTRLCDLAGAARDREIVSRNLVLATGASQRPERLHALAVAGRPLLPRFEARLMLSGVALGAGGAAEIERRLAGRAAPRVAVIGGSHSALATANLLLGPRVGVAFAPGAITLLHRRTLRVFYPSAAAAADEGYSDFDTDDICPVSQRLFRLAGFRLEARELVMRAYGIGGRPPEPRLRLHRLRTPEHDAEALRILRQADLIVPALGYRPRGLPLFDVAGHAIPLAADGDQAAALVDRGCRVLDGRRQPIPGVFGLGLAAGFVPGGPLGGEPSFRGQTNGIWLWQNGVGALVVDALLQDEARHVAA